ncbi:MAG TPA: TOBE domain-containing protein [Acidocella sp.]|nr:TOBE domain-containing protein [Acidocella sp.]
MNQGVIAQIGTPAELYDRPASPFVARFLGAANLLNARLLGTTGGSAELEAAGTKLGLSLDAPAPQGPDVLLCVRPERLSLTDTPLPGLSLPATVESRSFLGLVERVQLRLADGQVVILDLPHRGPPPPDAGTAVHLALEPGTTRLFASEPV